MKKLRFLFITSSFALRSGANMLRYRSLASYLVKHGHEVDVIGMYELQEQLEKGISYFQLKRKLSAKFFIYFFLLFFQNLYLLSTMSFVRYIDRIGLAALTLVEANRFIKKKNYDTCLVSVAPWAYYLIIKHLSKKLRVFIDICDPLYKNALFPKGAYKANLKMEYEALESANVIATVNEPTIKIMTDEMGIAKEKIYFITPSMNVGDNWKRERIDCQFHKPLRLIYSGSLYAGYRDLSEVQPAIELCSDVSLDIYSNSKYQPKKSACIHAHDVVPHDDLLKLYQQYDILLFVDNFYGYQVPSKIFELLVQNKPILFIYDKRNTYFYDMLKGQEGITFVENNQAKIFDAIKMLIKKGGQTINYTVDLSDYSEQAVNKKLLKCIMSNN